MPGGTPVDLATLSRSALVMRAVMGSLIAAVVLAVTIVRLVDGWSAPPVAAASPAASAFWWFFVGSHVAGAAFCGWWLVRWNTGVLAEFRRRRQPDRPPAPRSP